MKKIVICILTIVSFNMHASPVKSVAILDPICRDNSVPNFYSQMVRGAIESAITNTEEYESYDRTAIDKIMEEHNFQRTSVVDNSQIRQLGKLAGVDYVLVSEISAYDGFLTTIVKILDVTTGKYDKSVNGYSKMNPDEVNSQCLKLANALLDTSTYKEQAGIKSTEVSAGSKEDIAIAKANQFGSLFNQKGSNSSPVTNLKSSQRGNPIGYGSQRGSWSLAGRSVGLLPMPSNDFRQEGKVIVEIRVNAAGDVVHVSHKGGSIHDEKTIKLAIDAAYKAKFTKGDHDQIGTITYIFTY